jgi:hydrogenase-4 component E
MQEPFRTNLAVSLTVFILGLYCILSRRDAIKTVHGLLVLENGVHLSLVSLAPLLRETAIIGIVTDVVVAAYLLLYIILGVFEKFGSTDTFQLKGLRW